MNKLRQIVLESGSTDPLDWDADSRREAVIELFLSDEKNETGWVCDALAEGVAFRDRERMALIEAMKHDSPTMRHAAIGIIVERALLHFPLDSLRIMAEEREGAWLAEERACAIERDQDAAFEERLLKGNA